MEVKFRSLIFLSLTWVLLLGAGPAARGFRTGTVVSVNRDAGIISVDLGSRDHVIKGMTFAVVDKAGCPAATAAVQEVYDDLFWSAKLTPEEISAIRPGFQVKWMLTPEVTALVAARKKDTVKAYKDYVSRFRNGRFLSCLISSMPEEKLREVNRDYFDALKSYRAEDFKKIIEKYPGSGFAKAAEAELKNIEAYEAEQARVKAEREKRAAEAEEERKRREAIDAQMRQRQEKAFKREALGKLVNNSMEPVRFVFEEPSDLPATTVPANSSMEARQAAGSYKYKIFKVEEQAFTTDPNASEQPVKEGNIDIQFDFWEINYP